MRISATVCTGVLALLYALSGCERCSPDGAYCVQEMTVGEMHEYCFFHQEHHFMSLIVDSAGAVAIRPHPGVDVNGWGLTWYPQAFLPPGSLNGALVNGVDAANDGICVFLSGNIAADIGEEAGTWALAMRFSDDRELKQVVGTGEYAVALAAALSAETGDLNLGRIASNFLDDVPLLGGGEGDTGDMAQADVSGGTPPAYDFAFTWIPPDQPSHYPADTTDTLSIHVLGQYNIVDTAAMGYAPIEAAYKPSLKLVWTSVEPGAGLTFGAAYDLVYRQDFAADNVGITPLIRVGNTRTSFHFDVEFASTPPAGDGA